mmetsp:Transcript_52911/g.119171  ORF Transcript_52911/g.119171 Transcript_52911/m.119171 type:complete len:161 (-) Transcript_52911:14-496(-)
MPPRPPATPPTFRWHTPTPMAEPVSQDQGCARVYSQCGGLGWTGPTCCQAGSSCQQLEGASLSQCRPDVALVIMKAEARSQPIWTVDGLQQRLPVAATLLGAVSAVSVAAAAVVAIRRRVLQRTVPDMAPALYSELNRQEALEAGARSTAEEVAAPAASA